MPISHVTEIYDPPLKEIRAWKWIDYKTKQETILDSEGNEQKITVVEPKLRFPLSQHRGSRDIQDQFGKVLIASEVGYVGNKDFVRNTAKYLDYSSRTWSIVPDFQLLPKYDKLLKELKTGFCVFDNEEEAMKMGAPNGQSFLVELKAFDVKVKGYNGGNYEFVLANRIMFEKDKVMPRLIEIQDNLCNNWYFEPME